MNNISILIVEDEIELKDQLVEYFEIYFTKVYDAADGLEAYNIYNKYKPNIIFTDINMPKSNGLEFIQKVRAVDKKTPIVILTAHTDTSYLLNAIELNLVSYLLKPIEASKLKETIEKILKNINSNNYIHLADEYSWNKESKLLFFKDTKLNLSNYELLFLECLILNKNTTVSHEVLHNFIYNEAAYSQNAISSLVKRLRQKTSKNIVKSSYKEGYKIEI